VAIGDQRKELEDFKCSKGDQVRGAELRLPYCFIKFHELYDDMNV